MSRETGQRTKTLARTKWRKSERSSDTGNGNCVEVACLHEIPWRKSNRSQKNGACVEVGCLHGEQWRKSTRSSNSGNGNCVEARSLPTGFFLRDSKLSDDSPVFDLAASDFAGLLAHLKADS
jgi:hypothetical protein